MKKNLKTDKKIGYTYKGEHIYFYCSNGRYKSRYRKGNDMNYMILNVVMEPTSIEGCFRIIDQMKRK